MVRTTRVSAKAITKLTARITCVALFPFMMTACTRSVQWEEQVVLNTGETIMVERHGNYTFIMFSGASGFVGYEPDWRSTIEFTYKGKRYAYTGDASIQLLAIAPDLTPVLVADANGWGNKNSYPCVTPYYVEFIPDKSGRSWSWPPRISSWLYDLPTNLMIGLAPLDSTQRRFDAAARRKINASLLSYAANYERIDPGFKPENCVKRN